MFLPFIDLTTHFGASGLRNSQRYNPLPSLVLRGYATPRGYGFNSIRFYAGVSQGDTVDFCAPQTALEGGVDYSAYCINPISFKKW